MDKINYYWRLLATAISFGCFGIGGVILWLVVFPLMSFWPQNRQRRIAQSQRLVHYTFYWFIGLMHRLGVMSYEIDGLEKLNRPGQLVIANHPTLVDIVFLISRIQQASCIVKASLWRNPAMRGPILNAGYISNADSQRMIDDCAAWLQSGGSLVIFPEGTRSVPGQEYRFQRGTAAIALQSGAIVTPVTLTCSPSTLTKGLPWYRIPARRFHLSMQVGDDLDLTSFQQLQPRSIAVRRLTRHFQEYFACRRQDHQTV